MKYVSLFSALLLAALVVFTSTPATAQKAAEAKKEAKKGAKAEAKYYEMTISGL